MKTYKEFIQEELKAHDLSTVDSNKLIEIAKKMAIKHKDLLVRLKDA